MTNSDKPNELKIFDTHSHMFLKDFDHDRDACMAAAREAGVYCTALPNIDVSTISALRQMMDRYPNQVIGMMGLHPSYVKEDFENQLNEIKKELDLGIYKAVGEIGIDLYWDKTFINQQLEAFEIQVNWAKEKNLPVVIHSRNSFREIFEVLDKVYDERLSGVFHCFTGNGAELEKALSYKNFFLGIGGVITFKNAFLDEVIARTDLNRFVLETDAPYLTPHPFRGKRNQTAYTKIIAEKMADVFNVPLPEMAHITTQNAKKLFKINE